MNKARIASRKYTFCVALPLNCVVISFIKRKGAEIFALPQQATCNLCPDKLADRLADAREPELETHSLAQGSANLLAHEHSATLLRHPDLVEMGEHLLECIGLCRYIKR